MKISLTKSDALLALKRCANVAKARTMLPIISCVLLDASEDSVRMTATDLEQEVTIAVPAVVEKQGKAAIPLARLVEIATTVPDDSTITINCTDTKATITSARRRFMVGTLPHHDFPLMERRETVVETKALFDDMHAVLSAVDYAAPKDDVRYYLNGALLTVGGGKLRAVATNGHILGIAEGQCGATGAEVAVILPKHAIRTILRLSQPSAQEVTLRFGERFLTVVTSDGVVSVRCIDGKFPDYNRIIPTGQGNIAVINRGALLDIADAASVCKNGEFVGVLILFSKDKLEIRSKDINGDTADVDVPALYVGEDLEVSVSAKYLTGILRSMSCASVRISMTDAMSAIMVEDDESETPKYVLMPLRL